MQEKINNEKRFTMLFAPITRLYTETYQVEPDMSKTTPCVCNKLSLPKGMAENLAYLEEWKRMWKGDVFCYEYHFHMHQYFDMGGIYLAKLVYDDIHGLKKNGLNGIVEDCSQRSFFPTGLAFYVYGEALFDLDKSFETLVEEYFSAAFGKDWRLSYDYLSAISENTEFGFVAGEETPNRYDPTKVPSFEKIIATADAFAATIDSQIEKDVRCQYVHWDLMRWQVKYAKLYAQGMIHLANGNAEESSKSYVRICNELALLFHLRPTVFDHRHMTIAAKRVLSPKKSYSQVLIEE